MDASPIYLIKAPGGAADANGDAGVTVRETAKYQEETVEREARRRGSSQAPSLKVDLAETIYLPQVDCRFVTVP